MVNMKVIWQPEGFLNELHATLGEKLEESSEVINLNSQNICPVDTGTLQESIDHRTDMIELTTTIGTDVKYAPFVEFGTRKMASQSFLRKAIIISTQLIRNIFSHR